MKPLVLIALGAALSAAAQAAAFEATCGGVKPQRDAFVRWAEEQARWRPGDVKIDPRNSPPIEAEYCGTRILAGGRLYAIYVRRISP